MVERCLLNTAPVTDQSRFGRSLSVDRCLLNTPPVTDR